MKRVLLLIMTILIISCSKEENFKDYVTTDSYTLVYTTKHLPEGFRVYAGTTVTYSDSFEFINSDYNEEANTVVVETKNGPVKIDSNLYAQGGSEVTIVLYNSSGDIVDQRTISGENYNYIYEF